VEAGARQGERLINRSNLTNGEKRRKGADGKERKRRAAKE
jgi:hypothetical protein